jgi:hypothetical protein
MRNLRFGLGASVLLFCASSVAQAQSSGGGVPMDRVYQGQIRLPDFAGRDQKYATFRTRIGEGMKTGPDFAGHYAIIQIGCGTECTFAYVADVATGQVYGFPYGGEEYRQMQILRSAKSNLLSVLWISHGQCYRDSLTWNGASFTSNGRIDLGSSDFCERL